MAEVVAVVLAGGQGARFWPVSRAHRPKQFLTLGSSAESLIQATVRRIEPLVRQSQTYAKDGGILIVTNELLRPLCHEHVPHARIVCEPMGRNTAASIGLAALHVQRADPRAVMAVLPADHAVADEQSLRDTLMQAIAVAESSDVLVTIGIPPSFPHTGYGYIWRGERGSRGNAFAVKRFFEKPNLERAQKYCASGEYYWNSGMFVWRADVILDSIDKLMPQLGVGLRQIAQALGSPEEAQVIRSVFESLESISIDFGVLELARNCVVVEAKDFGWNDVGSWDAVSAWDTEGKRFVRDGSGNLLHGDTLAIESEHCIVHGQERGGANPRFIALLGVHDLVVIDSGDAVLVCPKSRVQDVKRVVDSLNKAGRSDLV